MSSGSARPWWQIVASLVGLGLAIAYWYPRMEAGQRDGWLRIVLGIFFGIVIPGLVLFAIIAAIRAFKNRGSDGKK